jgi:hypothetical protein
MLCGCAHTSSKYALEFIPKDSEKETPERAYVCFRSPGDMKAHPDETGMTCVEYETFMDALQESRSKKTSDRHAFEL